MDEIRDADLIRHLDGEPHGGVTPEQHARLDVLRRRSHRLSDLLAELDPTAAETGASALAIRTRLARRAGIPGALKVAAAIVLLLGLTLAVPPARAWMFERARAAAVKLGLIDRQTATSAQTGEFIEPPEGAAVRISFPVTTDTLDVAVAPAVGLMVIRRNLDATLATAETVGASDAIFTVSRGLRIEGSPAPEAIYTVTLPAHVTAVRLRGRVFLLPAAGDLRLDLVKN